jgi:hypothetical protein
MMDDYDNHDGDDNNDNDDIDFTDDDDDDDDDSRVDFVIYCHDKKMILIIIIKILTF